MTTNVHPIPFQTPEVAIVFDRFPDHLRPHLLGLRDLIFATAAATDGVGPLQETLKWGQPSYRTTQSGSGTTLRLGLLKGQTNCCALFVHCQTTLIADFRARYPDRLRFEGKRALVFAANAPLPVTALRTCITLALTYHLRKKPGGDV
ncbi:DUF1801 domain-containing protein [Acanthopleuribacter pedis]|uniref:DUF1801 domain-containing protein n=1 Tax=Acanthopleuribacter pedis TaxID=442870 RepID=A0A8J7U2J9_9BACT|nr:DUF1801 domain-containing protein [Acanthopleuribacter pedis]MBO1319398.1 DUF1801 domain-containing protein [Acanthopleuribacter pedis]